jgi:CheY-like chemotaxis protein
MTAVPTVLIAEDFPEYRAKLTGILEAIGLSCVLARNGREAIDTLRDRARRIDLLITDMDMPVHSGWEVIDAARRLRGADLPVIMQTGEAGSRYVREKAAALGIVLIGKQDIAALLATAVRAALRL